MLVARESDAGVDDDQLPADLVDRHVLAHLAEPAQRDHAQYVTHQGASVGGGARHGAERGIGRLWGWLLHTARAYATVEGMRRKLLASSLEDWPHTRTWAFFGR